MVSSRSYHASSTEIFDKGKGRFEYTALSCYPHRSRSEITGDTLEVDNVLFNDS